VKTWHHGERRSVDALERPISICEQTGKKRPPFFVLEGDLIAASCGHPADGAWSETALVRKLCHKPKQARLSTEAQ
jgi:hypothetical protein